MKGSVIEEILSMAVISPDFRWVSSMAGGRVPTGSIYESELPVQIDRALFTSNPYSGVLSKNGNESSNLSGPRGNASLAIEYGLQSRSLPEPSLRSHRTSSLTVTTQLWRYPKCGWCCDPSR